MRTTALSAAALAASLGLSVLAALPAGAAAPTCDGKAATITLQPPTTYPIPWVVGTPGDDVIIGTDNLDKIDGAGGNDTICGLGNADQIIGGPGDDRLFGGDDDYFPDDDYHGDMIQPGAGDDYVDLGADIGPRDMYSVDRVYGQKVSYADAPGPVTVDLGALTATGHGTDTIAPTPVDKYTGVVGSPYADVLVGGPAHDQIYGGGGDDAITGGPGEDDLDGDGTPGLDHQGGAAPGNDTLSGGPGDDSLSGGHGTDMIRGDDGDDYVVGQRGAVDTTLVGGPGDDLMSPTAGTTARAGAGDDVFEVDLERRKPGELDRTIAAGPGRDRLEFSYYGGLRPGYDLVVDVPRRLIRHHGARWATLTGVEEFLVDGNRGRGSVTFRGGSKAELFRIRWAEGFTVRASGGRGNDVLIGGDRDDVLRGGPGRDRLEGYQGRDRCLSGERFKSCERRR